MRVGVIGATGVVGRNILPRLVERGHAVKAGTKAPAPAGNGSVEWAAVDILDAGSLLRFAEGCEAIVNVASAIPRKDRPRGDWDIYDRIRREGTRHLIEACGQAGARLVQQSVAMLHGADTGRPQTEPDPLVGEGILAAGREVEATIGGWGGDWRIVRGGALYGPGTSTDGDWFAQMRRGELRAPDDGSGWVSPIHVADLAAAFVTVLEEARPRSAWIAADDRPLRWSELFGVVARLAGGDPSAIGRGAPARLPSFRVSNAALRGLGWSPRFASVASGLVATAETRR